MTVPMAIGSPAPLASTNGTAPSTVAITVMRIGRSRHEASTTCAMDLPSLRSWLANSTMRMPFLAMSPISSDADLAVEIELKPVKYRA